VDTGNMEYKLDYKNLENLFSSEAPRECPYTTVQ
jgi:hypothetical protein